MEYQQKINENYHQLTKGLKRVADFLLNDPAAFAARSAKKVGESIGVSETMVVRLCYALGYKGYAELQEDVRKSLYNMYTDVNDYLPQAEKETLSPYHKVMRMDQINIEKIANDINQETINRAVEKLAQADRILVAGSNLSFSMAHWMYSSLSLIRDNCYLFRSEDTIHLNYASNKSVLIAFSFYRYAMETLAIAEEAKKKGMFIIAFTDSNVAPIAELANLAFTIELGTRSIIKNAPVTFSLMNLIIMDLSQRNDKNLRLTESSHINKFFVK